MTEIRRLEARDAADMWKLRLEALEREPSSFAEAPEELRQVTVETYAERLGPAGNDDFVLGAFCDGKLAGMAGFHREPRVKRRHKGMVWGVYVSPEHRGKGVARALLTRVIENARMIDGLAMLTLSVNTEQETPRRLYASLGFEPWGVERGALKVGEAYFHEEYMVLRLTEL